MSNPSTRIGYAQWNVQRQAEEQSPAAYDYHIDPCALRGGTWKITSAGKSARGQIAPIIGVFGSLQTNHADGIVSVWHYRYQKAPRRPSFKFEQGNFAAAHRKTHYPERCSNLNKGC